VKRPNNLAWGIRLQRSPTGFFYAPQICDTGQTALLPFRRKACWGFLGRRGVLWHLITLDDTHTLGRYPLDEGSASPRGLYLHNTQHSQETSMHPGGYEPAITVGEYTLWKKIRSKTRKIWRWTATHSDRIQPYFTEEQILVVSDTLIFLWYLHMRQCMSTEMLFVSTGYRLPYQEGVFVHVCDGEATAIAAGLFQYCSTVSASMGKGRHSCYTMLPLISDGQMRLFHHGRDGGGLFP
jgi:hypothetical protein